MSVPFHTQAPRTQRGEASQPEATGRARFSDGRALACISVATRPGTLLGGVSQALIAPNVRCV